VLTPVLRSTFVAMALGRDAGPRACLDATADASRIGQDLVAGTGIVGLAMLAAVSEPVPGVALACAADAAPEERANAAREAESIARHTPSIGDALALELGMAGQGAREAAHDLSSFPLSWIDGDDIEYALRDPWVVRRAWALLVEGEAELVALGAADHPRAIDVVAARDARLSAAGNPLVAGARVAELAERDAAAQARLRITAIGLRALADAGGSGALAEGAPALAADPAMADPFAAAPVRWRRDAPGRARLWSIGPNRTDDGGAGDDLVFDVAD
jgi:hypothetical protein